MGDAPHLGGGMGALAVTDMQLTSVNAGPPGGVLSPVTGGSGGRSAEERQLSQWGYHETKELISLRAELEKDFVQTKGSNRTMWEVICGKMKDRGYRRTPAQCKCKWKVLVNRYKGKEISEDGEKAVPPFYEELDAIFKERARNMDTLLLQSEGGAAADLRGGGLAMTRQLKAKPMKGRARSDEENSDEEEEHEEVEEVEDVDVAGGKRKKPVPSRKEAKEKKSANSMQEVLEQFFLQQLKLEQEWREAIDRREAERRLREKEWRERMDALEKERLEREKMWRWKEEERRAREHARAEQRDQLIQSLLAKLG